MNNDELLAKLREYKEELFTSASRRKPVSWSHGPIRADQEGHRPDLHHHAGARAGIVSTTWLREETRCQRAARVASQDP